MKPPWSHLHHPTPPFKRLEPDWWQVDVSNTANLFGYIKQVHPSRSASEIYIEIMKCFMLRLHIFTLEDTFLCDQGQDVSKHSVVGEGSSVIKPGP